MNLREISDTSKPAFLRLPVQSEAAQGASATETPGDSQKSIAAFTKQVQLTNVGGEWSVDLNNGEDRTVITGGNYDPPFRVRGFKVIQESESLVEWVYDTPFSSKIIDTWAAGVIHPGHITRVWTGDPSMPANISISLLG